MLQNLEQKMIEIFLRSGVGEQARREIEDERKAKHARLMQQKAEVEREHAVRHKQVSDRVKAEEANLNKTRKANEEALASYSRARYAYTSVHDEYGDKLSRLDAQILAVVDPRIQQFRDQLQSMFDNCTALYRQWPDPQGRKVMGSNDFVVMLNNYEAVQSRANAILSAQDEVQRLATKTGVADLDTEFHRILKTIPDA